MQEKQPLLCGLGHIGIYISDVEKSVAFYESLGFECFARYLRPNGTILTFVRAGSCVLELIFPADKKNIGRPAGIVDHVCIAVQNIEAIVAAYQAKGIIEPDAKIGWMDGVFGGSKNIFFRGPDGERLELFESCEG